jgi:hypothetical protein
MITINSHTPLFLHAVDVFAILVPGMHIEKFVDLDDMERTGILLRLYLCAVQSCLQLCLGGPEFEIS